MTEAIKLHWISPQNKANPKVNPVEWSSHRNSNATEYKHLIAL